MTRHPDTGRDGVALVTGGGRGLGAAICHALAADSLAIAVNYLSDAQAAAQVCDAIRTTGGTAHAFQADVTDPADVVSLREAVETRLGEISVLVVNATGPQPDVALEELVWSDVVEQMRFFALSPLLLAQAVVPSMRSRGFGRIINIGSEAPELGVPHSSAYVAAKSAQLGLTRSWARELAPAITVNLVAPGFVPTDRHTAITHSERQTYAAKVPMGRLATATEVAAAVRYLASPYAGFVTGQRLAINGGNTLV